MKLYITFGQIHVHSVNGKTFDKDCVVEIECSTHKEGRDRAFELFGNKWAFDYPNNPPDMSFFPRGIFHV